MDQLHEPKSKALRGAFWRAEILEVIFWLRGEGFAERVGPDVLERFLGVSPELGTAYLEELVDEDLLARAPDGRYGLTKRGRRYAEGESGGEAVGEVTPGAGPCGPACWCHASAEEASACSMDAGRPHPEVPQDRL